MGSSLDEAFSGSNLNCIRWLRLKNADLPIDLVADAFYIQSKVGKSGVKWCEVGFGDLSVSRCECY